MLSRKAATSPWEATVLWQWDHWAGKSPSCCCRGGVLGLYQHRGIFVFNVILGQSVLF